MGVTLINEKMKGGGGGGGGFIWDGLVICKAINTVH